MTDVLLMRLDAPLMAFGAPMVDQTGPTRRFPGLAQLTGLFANALGWTHREADRLGALQVRLRLASVLLREGTALDDFQTVDLGQPFLAQGWTTRRRPEGREGGTAATGTHIRYRRYRAGALVLVAARLDPPEDTPTVHDIAAALDRPARPLFVGRKPCLPSGPLSLGTVTADGLVAALAAAVARLGTDPDWRARVLDGGPFDLADGLVSEWPADEPGDLDTVEEERLVDRRDWHSQIHGGERLVRRGRLPPPARLSVPETAP
jgi:CRISPR system Cascade subunit CasD